jgi:hypothetical protein
VEERKKTIRELEEKKRETRENLNKLRGSWGEAVLTRLDREDSDRFAGELGQYRHFLETIDGFRGRIRTLEADTPRLRGMEKALGENEKAGAEKTGALKELYIGLGKMALHNDDAFEFEGSLREQAEDLTARISAQQEKLGELEEGKGSGSGFFSWIGGNAQRALIRSRLSKNQALLNRLYAPAGEQFFAALERQGEDGEKGGVPARIRALLQELALLEESRSSLEGQRETLKKSLGIEGNSRNFNPAKAIKDQEHRIEREQEQLGELCAVFGERLYGLFAGIETGEGAENGAWLQREDTIALARIREMLDQIAGYEAETEKLRASLLIDEKRASIDKMKKSILSHRQRIANSESIIAVLEKQIEEANRNIEELMTHVTQGIRN